MSSTNYEANDYEHDLDLIIALHQLRILYLYTRSGCIEKDIQITQYPPLLAINPSLSVDLD